MYHVQLRFGVVACVAMLAAGCKARNDSAAKGLTTVSNSNQSQSPMVGGSTAEDCRMEIAAMCPSGMIDACLVNANDPRGHTCIPKTSAGMSADCSREIAAVCRPGYVDSCFLDPTTEHICVEDTRAQPEAFVVSTSDCDREVAALCPPGQVDACFLNPSDPRGHECVPDTRRSRTSDDCSREWAALCPPGYVDGCFLDPSTDHRCVPSRVGSCDMEIAAQCQPGYIDACLLYPDNPRGHICVREVRGILSDDCAMEIAAVCPPGQIDGCFVDPSSDHSCVPNPSPGGAESSAREFLDCDMEIARLCPPGQIDACFLRENNPGGHECVPDTRRSSSECAREVMLVCPPGMIDSCAVDPTSSNRRCVARN